RARHDQQSHGAPQRHRGARRPAGAVPRRLYLRFAVPDPRHARMGPRVDPPGLETEGRRHRERRALACPGRRRAAAPRGLALGPRPRRPPAERVRQPPGDPGGAHADLVERARPLRLREMARGREGEGAVPRRLRVPAAARGDVPTGSATSRLRLGLTRCEAEPPSGRARTDGARPSARSTHAYRISLSKTSAKRAATLSPTSSRARSVPVTLAREVTPWSRIPQGTMASKKFRSVVTLSAKPCDVIHPLETRTPIAAIFSSPTHTPVNPCFRPASTPKSASALINASSMSRT